MPQLERNDLYEALSRENYPDHIPPATNPPPPQALPFLALMVCPSDPQSAGPVTSYCYNYGYADNNHRNRANGIFDIALPAANRSTPLNFVGVKDGTSNTVLLSENIDAQNWCDTDPTRVTFAWHDTANVQSVAINRGVRRAAAGPRPPVQPSPPPSPPSTPSPSPAPPGSAPPSGGPSSWDICRPSSNHPAAVNVAFCDGHVRIINEGIDYTVWVALMAPHHAAATSPYGSAPTYAPVNVPVRQYIYDESHLN